MRNHDIERAIDTVLSGLTVDSAQQERLIRNAIQSSPKKRHRSQKAKLHLKLSISSPLPHLVVAALVVVIVTIAPLFKLPQQDPYTRYSSEDGQDYYVTGDPGPSPNAGAIAAPGDLQETTYRGTSYDDAEKAYQAHLPRITWLPEGAALEDISIYTSPEFRSTLSTYENPYIQFRIYDFVNGEMGLIWVPQDQEDEYMTLSNGQKIYVTTNYGEYTIVWEKGYCSYRLSTEASLEEAIRMIESIQ